MKKIYYLSTCSTCRRIIKEVEPDGDFVYQDLKKEAISAEQLEMIQKLTGSYSSVFNKQSRKYRALGLHNEELDEEKMRELILGEYTFLKRPIFIIGDSIFVGNSKKVTNELSMFLNNDAK